MGIKGNDFIFKKLMMLMAVLSVGILQSSGSRVLHISFYSGENWQINLSEKPEILFEGRELVVKSVNSSTVFDRDEIAEFSFIENDSGIVSLPVSSFRMDWIGNRIIKLYGENILPLMIYDLNGNSMDYKCQYTDDSLILNIENLESGLYIIRMSNKQSFKILIK